MIEIFVKLQFKIMAVKIKVIDGSISDIDKQLDEIYGTDGWHSWVKI